MTKFGDEKGLGPFQISHRKIHGAGLASSMYDLPIEISDRGARSHHQFATENRRLEPSSTARSFIFSGEEVSKICCLFLFAGGEVAAARTRAVIASATIALAVILPVVAISAIVRIGMR